MRKRVTIVAASVAAAGLAAAFIVPGVANGNARDTLGSGAAATKTATPLVATLSGANEVPPADPDGSGAAAVTIDAATGEICFDATVADIATVAMGHIHRGVSGTNGPVVVPFPTGLPQSGTPGAGCVTADPALAAEILANPAGFYVNFHTGDFPAGAIRGQLSVGAAPAGPAHFLATPLRAYDSRVGTGPLKANETRTISLQTGKALGATTAELAVPPGATGAIVNITVTETVNGGYVKLYSAAIGEPATSTINWSQSNENLAVNTSVAVDGSGKVKITGGVNDTQVVIDVVGYYF
jgi:CHRD domain